MAGECQVASAYIEKLIMNSGQQIDIKENDIIVFVGPNNAGKSQSLRDIFALSDKLKPTIVIKDIIFNKKGNDLESLLSSVALNNGDIHGTYEGMGGQYPSRGISHYKKDNKLGQFRNLFVSYLNTENRLQIVKPQAMINRDSPKTHPIHFALHDKDYANRLSANFKKAFNIDLMVDEAYGKDVPLCVGEQINENWGNDNFATIKAKYSDIIKNYPHLENQGDGMKSFAGILLNLMLEHYCTYIIDEPESFLHPPQAFIMGRLIGETLSDMQQCFISTHSKEVIKGLIDVCPNRVKIIRITRENNENNFSILDNSKITEIWSDPLLKYSEIMDSVFYNKTVLCESDSDCKIYSLIEEYNKKQVGKFADALFVHCGGKQRMHKIVSALKSLGVDYRVVPDIDILNDVNVIKTLIESSGGDWNSFDSLYKTLENDLNQGNNTIKTEDYVNAINELQSETLTKKQMQKLLNDNTPKSKWDILKAGGKTNVPSGNATKAFNSFVQLLKNINIHLVECGELESFDKEICGHGPKWANAFIEKHTDLDSPELYNLREFVKSWNL